VSCCDFVEIVQKVDKVDRVDKGREEVIARGIVGVDLTFN
jgi:hypothetical protein